MKKSKIAVRSATSLVYSTPGVAQIFPWVNTILFVFLEQEVDGETLLMLCTAGSIDQLHACGLRTVKQQMKLRKLSFSSPTPNSASSDVGSSISALSGNSDLSRSPASDRKLTKAELNALSPEDKRVYLMM